MKYELTEQLIRHEGIRLKPYWCTSGKLTIGVGRNLDDVGITEVEARRMLSRDVHLCIDDCIEIFDNWKFLSLNRRLALADMRFNLGSDGLKSFKNMIYAVNNSDFSRAAFEMENSKWFLQVGERAKTLQKMMLNG